MRGRIAVLSCLLLGLHLSHVAEEVAGRLFLIDRMGGLAIFLSVNTLLLAAILVVLAESWRGRRWAVAGMKVWAIAETINGAGHILATQLTWFADLSTPGWISGMGLVLVAPMLLFSLRAENRPLTR